MLRNRGDDPTDGFQDDLREVGQLLGRKWHLPVIIRLQRNGAVGFSELQRELDDISSKVLSETLKELEERRLVDRELISDRPLRVEYSLTNRGSSLDVVIEAIYEWHVEHCGVRTCEQCGEAPLDVRRCPSCSGPYCGAHYPPEEHGCPHVE